MLHSPYWSPFLSACLLNYISTEKCAVRRIGSVSGLNGSRLHFQPFHVQVQLLYSADFISFVLLCSSEIRRLNKHWVKSAQEKASCHGALWWSRGWDWRFDVEESGQGECDLFIMGVQRRERFTLDLTSPWFGRDSRTNSALVEFVAADVLLSYSHDALEQIMGQEGSHFSEGELHTLSGQKNIMDAETKSFFGCFSLL